MLINLRRINIRIILISDYINLNLLIITTTFISIMYPTYCILFILNSDNLDIII